MSLFASSLCQTSCFLSHIIIIRSYFPSISSSFGSAPSFCFCWICHVWPLFVSINLFFGKISSTLFSSSCRFEMKHQVGLRTDPVKRRHMLTSAANQQPGRCRRRVRSHYNHVRTNAGLVSRDDTSQAQPGSFFSCFFLVSGFFIGRDKIAGFSAAVIADIWKHCVNNKVCKTHMRSDDLTDCKQVKSLPHSLKPLELGGARKIECYNSHFAVNQLSGQTVLRVITNRHYES